ncbi:hypothetical protein AADZ90_000260 [Aestuariibius sp. 2305UL40-4]|uniref:hypothetical protein n=1 Tax=Aestuariibius violaceus TaxID=3234132 RepID=UPI00345E3EBE
MDKVIPLRPMDSVDVDLDRLQYLLEELGASACADTVDRSIDRLATDLKALDCAHADADLIVMVRISRSIAEAAGRIGLTTLANAAGCVVKAVRARDPVATNATIARVGRVAIASLAAIEDPEDAGLG